MSIIAQVKKGDEEAFAELIEEYKLQIYKTAKAILRDEDDVCDAIQDTALSIYKNINNLKNEKHFKTWVIRITINKCYDIIEKHRLNNAIEKIDLERSLDLLEDELRIVTVLYYYNDLSISEISKILNIPKGTVKSRVFRAREKLYELLSKEEVAINE